MDLARPRAGGSRADLSRTLAEAKPQSLDPGSSVPRGLSVVGRGAAAFRQLLGWVGADARTWSGLDVGRSARRRVLRPRRGVDGRAGLDGQQVQGLPHGWRGGGLGLVSSRADVGFRIRCRSGRSPTRPDVAPRRRHVRDVAPGDAVTKKRATDERCGDARHGQPAGRARGLLGQRGRATEVERLRLAQP